MALLSIEPFLARPEKEARYEPAEAAACRKVVSMLLEGIAAHALDLDREARDGFRERIAEIHESMDAEASAETLLENAASAVQAIGDYARQTTRLVRNQGAEMQNLVALLARTATEIGGTGGRTVSRLRKIGDNLERLSALMGVSTLKARVRECLADIGKEAKQQETDWERMVQALRRAIARKEEVGHSACLDPVAEQPSELIAQAQLLSALRTNSQRHVAVFVLASARDINLQFGRVAGDEVVRALKHYLSDHLGSNDRMFRWSGPAIVAALAGTESSEQVHARVNRLVAKTIERTFEIHGRPVSIPLSIAWSIFSLSQPLTDLNRQINDFIARLDRQEEGPIPA
ncbi:MAG: diguanylate cyclase domain-containing protein [Bryobacteraceae bacterium]